MKKNETNEMAKSEFRAELEKKVNQLLAAKLEGDFKTVVAPQGFHWGVTYGSMGYYNQKTLQDVDTMLVFDDDGQAGFRKELFSTLYQKILADTSFQYSKADQSTLDQLRTEAMLTSQDLVSAYKDEVGDIQNPQNPLIEIIGFVNAHKEDKDFQNIYPTLAAQYNTFLSHNAKYIEMTSRELDAINYVKQLIDNMKNPSKSNAGVQIDAANYSVGYSMADVNQIYNELSAEDNKMTIDLEFSDFSETQSSLSIDHQAAFVIPLPICFFIKSDTRYTLNSLTTSSSTVSIIMEYRGVTTLDATPALASADGMKGWYDENLLDEIKNKTGKDVTGYQLQNDEFKVEELFGADGKVNRMKEFVISQAPVITMTITHANISMVTECFTHRSELDIDFFGFGISSSTHNYSVQNCTIDTSSNTATITLSAPTPSMGTDLQDKVAYVLGGVIVYPPEVKSVIWKNCRELFVEQADGKTYNFTSKFLDVGELLSANPNYISNAQGTGGDKFVDIQGNVVNKSWISLWEDLCNNGRAASCAVCGSRANVDGAHVLYDQHSRTLNAGDVVCIVPLCRGCNHPTNTSDMRLRQDTNTIYMSW